MATEAEYISILQLTDLHILPNAGDTLLGIDTELSFHAVLNRALGAHPHFDLLLLTGDLAQEPCLASYQRILNTLESLDIPCICLPGNHDDYALMQQIFNTASVNCNKQVLLNNWQLICLNSQIPGNPAGRLAHEELLFLEHCLNSHPNRYALVAVHHHCLPSGSSWMDTMIIENSDALFSLISQYPKVKAITTGHIHQTMDVTTHSIRIMGSPSTCFQFKPKSTEFSVDNTAPGYRTLALYSDGRIESTLNHLPEPLTGLQTDKHNY
jgi:3',5'-cyclic-AMP phosphodiesterase